MAVRRDAVHFALVAGSDVKVALAVEGHAPDVLGLGIVNHFGLTAGFEAIDLAVRRGRGEHLVAAVDRDGVHFHPRKFADYFRLAARIDEKDLGGRGTGPSSAGVEIAFRVGG